jgi:hypothetical protein
MDRDELEERVRGRPAGGGFRRGQPIDEQTAAAGYVPFTPEPEDALAVRPEAGEQGVYTGPPPGLPDETDLGGPPPGEPPPLRDVEPQPYEEPAPPPPVVPPPPVPPAAGAEPYAAEPYPDEYDDRPYGEPEDAYAYPYAAEGRGRGGGGSSSALPIIGFVVLCVLALAVGAVLAGILGGTDGVGQASPTPIESSAPPTPEPTPEPTPVPTASGPESSSQPTSGPVTFPDGAVYAVQPCGTYEFRPDLSGCLVEGSTRDSGDVWILVVFKSAKGSDTVTLQLKSDGQTLDQQQVVLNSIVNCGNTCNGLIWGAVYRDLLPGDYELVLQRNGEFADSAPFTVDG